MSASFWPINKVIRISGAFVDVAGAAVDPSTVTLSYRKPDGTKLVKTYAGGDVVRDSAGNFHFDLDLDAAGKWRYRWSSTGPKTTQADQEMIVRNTETV